MICCMEYNVRVCFFFFCRVLFFACFSSIIFIRLEAKIRQSPFALDKMVL